MNFYYNHHIRSIFKSHSISVTFKFCAVRCSIDKNGNLKMSNLPSGEIKKLCNYRPDVVFSVVSD